MKDEDKTKDQVVNELVELRQRTAELENGEKRYQAFYEENPSMYFTADAEGKILSINNFGAEQLGYMPWELVGQSMLKVIYEDDKKVIIEQITACLQNIEQVATRELRQVRKDGSMLWVKEVARAVRGIDSNTVIP